MFEGQIVWHFLWIEILDEPSTTCWKYLVFPIFHILRVETIFFIFHTFRRESSICWLIFRLDCWRTYLKNYTTLNVRIKHCYFNNHLLQYVSAENFIFVLTLWRHKGHQELYVTDFFGQFQRNLYIEFIWIYFWF